MVSTSWDESATPSRQCRSYKFIALAKLLRHTENNVFVASGTAATASATTSQRHRGSAAPTKTRASPRDPRGERQRRDRQTSHKPQGRINPYPAMTRTISKHLLE